MSGAPYSLAAALCFDVVPHHVKLAMLREFFAIPLDCLSFMSRMLREQYSSPALMLQSAPFVLHAWMESLTISVDYSERAHAQMRKDICSSGPATSFVPACDRLLCRQFATSHMARGGMDPALAKLSSLEDIQPQPATKKPRSGIGSNPFIQFHAARYSDMKALMAPNRAFDAVERTNIETQISAEWSDLQGKPDELALWKVVFQNRHRPALGNVAPAAAQAHALVVCADPPKFVGIFGDSSDKHHVILPQALLDVPMSQNALKSSARKVAQSGSVRHPVPQRSSTIIGGWGSLYGCHASHKNVCRTHVQDINVSALNNWCSHFIAWVDKLTLIEKGSASALLVCKGSDSADQAATVMFATLLVCVHGSPKMQLLALCGLCLPGQSPVQLFTPLAPPFDITILSRRCRMSFPGCAGEDVKEFT
jgi:hypothetical protein